MGEYRAIHIVPSNLINFYKVKNLGNVGLFLFIMGEIMKWLRDVL
jgi:hypothetical protein